MVGIITWQGPLGSVDGSTVAITGGSGDYAGVTGQIVISNVIDSADCPCYHGDPPPGLPPCFKYELFLKDVEGTSFFIHYISTGIMWNILVYRHRKD